MINSNDPTALGCSASRCRRGGFTDRGPRTRRGEGLLWQAGAAPFATHLHQRGAPSVLQMSWQTPGSCSFGIDSDIISFGIGVAGNPPPSPATNYVRLQYPLLLEGMLHG